MKTSALLFGAGFALLIYGCGSNSSDQSSSSSTTPSSTGSTSTGGASAASTSAAGGTTGSTASSAGGTTTAASGTGYAAVQAIFNSSCMPCHSSQRPRAGLDLTSYDAVMKGGEGGSVVTAGDPAKSKLVGVLNGTMQPKMPKGRGPLSASDIKTVSDWVQAGAKNN